MAGPFRGAVGKLKKSKKGKFKKSSGSKALVRRGRKLAPEDVKARVDALIADPATEILAKPSGSSSNATSSGSFLSKLRTSKKGAVTVKSKTLEIVGANGEKQRVVDGGEVEDTRTTQEMQGLKMLKRAVKDQSHNRLLPHQQRHDYEFRLRRIATMGVVRLFNSLAQAQDAGDKVMDASQKMVTIDKAQERKLVASRDAFLSALRAPKGAENLVATTAHHDFY